VSDLARIISYVSGCTEVGSEIPELHDA
jgi:hypothetical protein